VSRPPHPPSAEQVSLRAAVPWVAGAIVYAGAMAQRMSIGILTPDAQSRLGVGNAELALLPVGQLLLYLAMQVPAGVLLDRHGPRVVLAVSSLVMGVGQVVFGVANSLGPAVLGRLLVGLGDATCFVGLLMLARTCFPARLYPAIAASTAAVAAAGQLLVTYPLAVLMREHGWTTSLFTLAGGAFAGAAAAWVGISGPGAGGGGHAAYPSIGAVLRLGTVPAAREGLLTHLTLMAPFLALAAMWGYPYLLRGVGLAPEPAALLLLAVAILPALTGPLVGIATSRRPDLLRPLVRASALVLLSVWTVTTLWPGPPPIAPVALTYLVTGACVGPALLAFEIARRGTPPELGGAISGFANIGGFAGSVTAMLAVGTVVDRLGGDAAAYQNAMRVLPVLVAAGLLALLAHHRRIGR